jgi:hypothetical protein
MEPHHDAALSTLIAVWTGYSITVTFEQFDPHNFFYLKIESQKYF